MGFETINSPTQTELAQLEVWPPSQGEIKEVAPVSVDLYFSHDTIELPNFEVTVRVRKAEIRCRLQNCRVVRDSQFGNKIRDRYVKADVTESARAVIEREEVVEGKGEFSIAQNIIGRLSVFWHRIKKTKESLEADNVINVTHQVFRVSYRGNGIWEIREPVSPRILDGRYLGEFVETPEGEKTDPLCAITFQSVGSHLDLFVTIRKADLVLDIHSQSGQRLVSRNREAIVKALIDKCLPRSLIAAGGEALNVSSDRIIVAHSRLRYLGDD